MMWHNMNRFCRFIDANSHLHQLYYFNVQSFSGANWHLFRWKRFPDVDFDISFVDTENFDQIWREFYWYCPYFCWYRKFRPDFGVNFVDTADFLLILQNLGHIFVDTALTLPSSNKIKSFFFTSNMEILMSIFTSFYINPGYFDVEKIASAKCDSLPSITHVKNHRHIFTIFLLINNKSPYISSLLKSQNARFDKKVPSLTRVKNHRNSPHFHKILAYKSPYKSSLLKSQNARFDKKVPIICRFTDASSHLHQLHFFDA